jgi:hypothetical protein
MFILSLPATVKVGDTVDCRINGAAARVAWREEGTLVIEPGDVREILKVVKDGDLHRFTCASAGMTRADYVIAGPLIYEQPGTSRPD